MKKKKSGFTLIEIILVLSITTIITGVIYTMFNTGNKIFSNSDIKSTLQDEAQNIQEKLTNIGMQAYEIDDNQIIKSLDKEYNKCGYKIEKNQSTLSIITYNGEKADSGIKNEEVISKNVKEFEINHEPNSRTIEINIILNKDKGYSHIQHPINMKITFRNKEQK